VITPETLRDPVKAAAHYKAQALRNAQRAEIWRKQFEAMQASYEARIATMQAEHEMVVSSLKRRLEQLYETHPKLLLDNAKKKLINVPTQEALGWLSDYFFLHRKLRFEDLITNSRQHKYVLARKIMWVLLREVGATTSELGAIFNRDHSSIVAGCTSLRKLHEKDPDYILFKNIRVHFYEHFKNAKLSAKKNAK
jgi:chromosomal replication initiation ATPase DnaA